MTIPAARTVVALAHPLLKGAAMRRSILLIPLALVGFLACGGEADLPDEELGESTDNALPPPDEIPDCNDNNPCTTDRIVGVSCRHTVRPNGSSCSDGNACNGAEVCQSGTCRAGRAPNCNDNNSCTDDYCDAVAGCWHENLIGACSDGNSCTVGDSCVAGVCRGQGSTSGPISAPAISGVTIVAGPTSQLLDRNPVYYLEGTELDISLRVPSCNYVTRVNYGSGYLTTAPRTDCDDVGVFDCQPNFYQVVRDVVSASGEHDLTIRLKLTTTTLLDGRAIPVSVQVESALGQVGHAFTLSRVADVSPQPSFVSFGKNDIHNAFVAGVYERFGDDGHYEICDGAPCPLEVPADTVAYAPDYQQTDAWVDTAGVHVRMAYSVEAPGWCNPKVVVNGIFQINNDLTVDWVSGPDANLDFAFYCDAIGGFIQAIVAGFGEDSAEQAMRDAVAENLSRLVGGSAPLGLVGFDYLSGEVRARFFSPSQAIKVELPYDPYYLPNASTMGIPVRANERFLVSASALVAGCEGFITPGQPCWGQSLGPAGVFNWWNEGTSSGSVPVPAPSASVPGNERWEARQALEGLARTSSELPRPDLKVGALLGRFAGWPTTIPSALVGPGGCGFYSGNEMQFLGLGPNDRRHASGYVWGVGKRSVYLTFRDVDITTCYPNTGNPADPGPGVINGG